MTDGIGMDVSGLRNLAADLGELAAKAVPNVSKAVEVTARHVKDDWGKNASKIDISRARAYPYTVDYDMSFKDGEISAEIGPHVNEGGQGPLGGILEESPGRAVNAPQQNARRALAKNVEDFERGILKATGGVTDA